MEFISGDGETTKIGQVNKNNQKCLGHRNVKGTDHFQYAYKTECLDCGNIYGSNGTDLHQRMCPICQGGAPSIEY